MEDVKILDFSKNIFEMSEETIYNLIEKFSNNQSIDKTLTYLFVKAFYIHIIRIYFSIKNELDKFENILSEYRNNIISYYKTNNSNISDELLNDIVSAFDKSFEILETIQFHDINDGYELRHHIIDSFEFLRTILEKKSKTNIRTDIFDNNITEIKDQATKILDYVANCNIID